MPQPEFTALARSLARSDPRDQVEQTQNLQRLQEVRRYLSDKDVGLSICVDAASKLINGLAWKGDLDAREILEVASQLMMAVERAWLAGNTDADQELPEMPRLNDMVLGEILVQLGFVGHKQVLEALRRAQTQGIRIGEALVELGFTSEKHVDGALRLQRKMRDSARLEQAGTVRPAPRPTVPGQRDEPPAGTAEKMTVTPEILLGEVLLGSEMITATQLGQAVRVQKATGYRFGKVLVEMGAVGWEDIEAAVELQKQLRLVAGLSQAG